MQKIFRKLWFLEKALLIGGVFFTLLFLLTKLRFDVSATSPTDPLSVWTQENNLPYSLASHVGFISNNHAYVISGAGDALHSDVLSATINQDSTLSSWSSVSNLPQTLIWHSFAQDGNTVYVLGGVNPGGLLNSVNTVYAASVNSDGSLTNWATLTPLPEGLDLGGALVWNNKLYYLGGEMRNNRISGSPILRRTIMYLL